MTQTNSVTPEAAKQSGFIMLKLAQFGFRAGFASVEEGPILRTFYFQPTPDSLFSKVFGKEEEIAALLAVETVRLFRSKGLLGVEIPQTNRQMIRFDSCLHTMFTSPATRDMALPLLMGQNPRGEYLFLDLATQPHALIAGATGSGKSVFISQCLCSMALFRSPQELEIILVDTKNLDLVLFKSLEHVKETITSIDVLRTKLTELLGEVRSRAVTMSGLARNIREYNALSYGKKLSYKVVIIDELADVLEQDNALLSSLDRADRRDTESISSLLKMITQLSRASGIHLIIATQRPSAKMITGDSKIGFGDIKANLPARICFRLPTMQDSRVVLDENGAELLLGKGDYLYKAIGIDTPQRAHSAFVGMSDIALILEQNQHIRNMYRESKESEVSHP